MIKKLFILALLGIYFLPIALFAQQTKKHISLSYKFDNCPVLQTSYQTGWAAGAAMMVAWKEDRCPDIDSVLQRAGGTYLSSYQSNQALSCDELFQLYQILGMKTVKDYRPAIEGWRPLLAGGPVLTTLGNHHGEGHVVFLNRLYEDTEQNQAGLGYYNPSSANQEFFRVDDFMVYYGDQAAYCGVHFAYWPNDSLNELCEQFVDGGEPGNAEAPISAPSNFVINPSN